ncbi:MAG: hypothetical protein KDD77_10735 [Caldilineaceae bacterium]|nr:hypothetical protein [Caldilineaceae bacterium]
MTTRLQLRTSLRERLEDTGDAPLWSDTALNEFLIGSMRVYGVQIPTQSTAATASIAAAATSVALPGGVDADEVVSVRNVAGETVPRFDDKVVGAAPLDSRGIAQGWVAWGATLRFRRPIIGAAEIGVWSIDYIGGRELVSDDVTTQPIVAGDEPIVVALAAAVAFDRRAAEYGKRGDAAASKEMREVAAATREDAATMVGARRRRPRSGFLHADGE